jgi:hypothetical protein
MHLFFSKEIHQTEENIEFEGKINEQSLALDILSDFFFFLSSRKI